MAATLDDISNPARVVTARDLTRRFGEVTALDHVSLAVRRGEFLSLLGPSGCGKTTLLRIIAGLDAPDSGTLELNGRDALPIPAHRRHVNTVFQSYALFPHLTVWNNVAFGLRMKRVAATEMKRRVATALELARIADLATRKPHELSGGQKQRAALARAIVNEPEVLLLDEPLAALDVKLRRELQAELHALQRRLGITFIHVTHDQDEALSLSDRVAVMRAGRIIQLGTPREIYDAPKTRFVAQFVGGCNLLDAAPVVGRSSRACLKTALGELEVKPGVDVSRAAATSFRPERILLGRAAQSVNRFEAAVKGVTFTGPETHLELETAGVPIRATAVNSATGAHFREGETIPFSVPPDALILLEE